MTALKDSDKALDKAVSAPNILLHGKDSKRQDGSILDTSAAACDVVASFGTEQTHAGPAVTCFLLNASGVCSAAT